MSDTSRCPPLGIVADDTTLTLYGGSVVVGELCRGLGLIEGLDRAIDGVRGARAFKQRRRGVSAGELIASIAESMLAGDGMRLERSCRRVGQRGHHRVVLGDGDLNHAWSASNTDSPENSAQTVSKR